MVVDERKTHIHLDSHFDNQMVTCFLKVQKVSAKRESFSRAGRLSSYVLVRAWRDEPT